MSELRRRTVRGLAWTGSAYAVREAVLFGAGILVARLLLPDDLGVFALATLAIAALNLARSLGLGAALVQAKEDTEAKRSTVFWTNVAVGLALSAGLYVAAPALAAAVGEPRLAFALRVLAPAFALDSLSAVHDAVLERGRQYRKRAVRDMAATTLGALLALGLALAGAGLVALLAQRLASSAISAVFLWAAVPWRPRFLFARAEVPALLAFGLPVAGWAALTWLSGNIDRLLVGPVLGAGALGLYALAFTIARGPGQLVQQTLGSILFPELSRLQDDLATARRYFLNGLRHILAALMLPLALLAALAGPFVRAVYGPQWSGAAPIVQLFAVVAAVPIAVATATWLYTSQGKTRQLFWTSLAYSAAVCVAFAVGLRWGLVGLAVGYAVAAVAVGLPYLALAFRSIGLDVSDSLKALFAPMLAWAEALAVATVMAALWAWGDWSLLAAASAAGAVGFALVLWLVDPGLLRSLWHLPRDLKGKTSPSPTGPPANPQPPGPGVEARTPAPRHAHAHALPHEAADWDGHAGDYLTGAERREPALRPVNEALLQACGIRPGRPLLDLACGPGFTTAAAAAWGADALGVDFSPAMVGLARRRFPGMRFEVGSMLDPPPGPWDAVTCRLGSHHVDDAWLASAWRVLAPDGRLAIAEICPAEAMAGRHGMRPVSDWVRAFGEAGFVAVAAREVPLASSVAGSQGWAEGDVYVIVGTKPSPGNRQNPVR